MNKDGWFAWFAYSHSISFGFIHGTSMFFPYHRYFLNEFEYTAKTSYNSKFFLPYWDSGRDYGQPHRSPILTSKYIGGNGKTNSCVQDGLQANWVMTNPKNHCLQRKYDNNGSIKPWYPPEVIASYIQQSKTMDRIRYYMEYTIHGSIHIGLNGDMSSRGSPNDFAFLLHHANIDRIWWKWQNIGNNLWIMDGPGPSGIKNLSYNNLIYNTQVPIRNVMQLGYGKFCYNYDDASGLIASSEDMANSNLKKSNVNNPQFFPNSQTNTTIKRRSLSYSSPPSNNSTSPSKKRKSHRHSKCHPHKQVFTYPPKMPEEWINMHHYDPAQVEAVANYSREILDYLNVINYTPPNYNTIVVTEPYGCK